MQHEAMERMGISDQGPRSGAGRRRPFEPAEKRVRLGLLLQEI